VLISLGILAMSALIAIAVIARVKASKKPKLTKQDADSFFIGVKADDKNPVGNSSYPASITRLPYKKRECEISRDEYEIGMSF
jgi:ABC-type thiamine transport system substrate-binding protein